MSTQNIINTGRQAALAQFLIGKELRDREDLAKGMPTLTACIGRFQQTPQISLPDCLCQGGNHPSPPDTYLRLLPEGMSPQEQWSFAQQEVNALPGTKPDTVSSGGMRATILTLLSVLQGTHSSELAAELLYRLICRDKTPFKFPKIHGWDLTRNSLITPDHITPLEESTANKVRLAARSIFKFVKLTRPCIAIEMNQMQDVIEMDRIQGPNLPKFIWTQYGNLPYEKKQALFQTLGSLALLDLALGNDDRLIHAEDEYNEAAAYAFYPDQTPNLENIMVDGDLFAIDNVPYSPFRENQEKYLTFLVQTFSQLDKIPPSIRDSIHTYFRTQDSVILNPMQQSEVNNFLADLNLFGIRCLGEGIQQMQGTLLRDILPYWRSEEANQSKAIVTTLDPKLVSIIDERLSAVESVLRERSTSTDISPELLTPFSVAGRLDSTTPLVPTPLFGEPGQ